MWPLFPPIILGYNICHSCCSIAGLETLEKTYFKLSSFKNIYWNLNALKLNWSLS